MKITQSRVNAEQPLGFLLEIHARRVYFCPWNILKTFLYSVCSINTHQMMFAENIHYYCGTAEDCVCQQVKSENISGVILRLSRVI